jgi:hypothetical protein
LGSSLSISCASRARLDAEPRPDFSARQPIWPVAAAGRKEMGEHPQGRQAGDVRARVIALRTLHGTGENHQHQQSCPHAMDNCPRQRQTFAGELIRAFGKKHDAIDCHDRRQAPWKARKKKGKRSILVVLVPFASPDLGLYSGLERGEWLAAETALRSGGRNGLTTDKACLSLAIFDAREGVRRMAWLRAGRSDGHGDFDTGGAASRKRWRANGDSGGGYQKWSLTLRAANPLADLFGAVLDVRPACRTVDAAHAGLRRSEFLGSLIAPSNYRQPDQRTKKKTCEGPPRLALLLSASSGQARAAAPVISLMPSLASPARAAGSPRRPR